MTECCTDKWVTCTAQPWVDFGKWCPVLMRLCFRLRITIHTQRRRNATADRFLTSTELMSDMTATGHLPVISELLWLNKKVRMNAFAQCCWIRWQHAFAKNLLCSKRLLEKFRWWFVDCDSRNSLTCPDKEPDNKTVSLIFFSHITPGGEKI